MSSCTLNCQNPGNADDDETYIFKDKPVIRDGHCYHQELQCHDQIVKPNDVVLVDYEPNEGEELETDNGLKLTEALARVTNMWYCPFYSHKYMEIEWYYRKNDLPADLSELDSINDDCMIESRCNTADREETFVSSIIGKCNKVHERIPGLSSQWRYIHVTGKLRIKHGIYTLKNKAREAYWLQVPRLQESSDPDELDIEDMQMGIGVGSHPPTPPIDMQQQRDSTRPLSHHSSPQPKKPTNPSQSPSRHAHTHDSTHARNRQQHQRTVPSNPSGDQDHAHTHRTIRGTPSSRSHGMRIKDEEDEDGNDDEEEDNHQAAYDFVIDAPGDNTDDDRDSGDADDDADADDMNSGGLHVHKPKKPKLQDSKPIGVGDGAESTHATRHHRQSQDSTKKSTRSNKRLSKTPVNPKVPKVNLFQTFNKRQPQQHSSNPDPPPTSPSSIRSLSDHQQALLAKEHFFSDVLSTSNHKK